MKNVKSKKKKFKFEEKTEEKKIKVSDTDPESGYYHRDNKEKDLYVCPKSRSNTIRNGYKPYSDKQNLKDVLI